jgi:hypothetical protein
MAFKVKRRTAPRGAGLFLYKYINIPSSVVNDDNFLFNLNGCLYKSK